MVRLEKLASNVYDLRYNFGSVYFSYETPIAFFDIDRMTLYVTGEFFSRTTSKHINLVKDKHSSFECETLSVDKFASKLENFIS